MIYTSVLLIAEENILEIDVGMLNVIYKTWL